MNYQHAFHAGNFADVLKHAVLCRVLLYLRQKPAPFRVIDTHAGAGCYDLTGPEASRSGEWRAGIGRLRAAALDHAVQELLAPYLEAIAALNPREALTTYPGSPVLARAFMRPHDRLVACELHPQAAAALRAALHGDARAKAVRIDGWTALSAYVPPQERRGLVLVDPPFEQPDEFDRLLKGVAAAYRKWPTGIYMLWYPIKDSHAVARFERGLRHSAVGKILRAELAMAPPDPAGPLTASGLVIINPPWTLAAELARLLQGLQATLGGPKGGFRIGWLAGENQAKP